MADGSDKECGFRPEPGGTGVGVTAEINDHMSLNAALAFPLLRTINGEEQSRTRIHFSFNSAF